MYIMPDFFGRERIIFTNTKGETYQVIEPSEINRKKLPWQEVSLKKYDTLWEIAQRENVYGPNSEPLWGKIFDKNATAITENNFKLDGIEKLIIPIL